MESLWSLLNIVGPLLLIAVLIWAFMRNRGGSRQEIERAEQGARELREQIDRDEAQKDR
jgi:hypothetical protein